MRKSTTFLFILILMLSRIIMVESSFAQTSTSTPSSTNIPTPSVPEFTVKFVNSSYEVPASYSIDPYTGKNMTTPSYYVENSYIIITITNQPFTPYVIDSNGNRVNLLYNVRMRGQYTENWTNLYNNLMDYPLSSVSNYTVLSFPVNTNASNSLSIPAGTQVDFQVEAMIGYGQVFEGFGTPLIFHGEISNWSSTQTITINHDSTAVNSSTSPNSTLTTPKPNTRNSFLFSLDWEKIALILLSIIVIILVFALVFSRKRNMPKSIAHRQTGKER